MKNNAWLIPLIIYPYAYLIWLVYMFIAMSAMEDMPVEATGTVLIVFIAVMVAFNVYSLVISIYNAVATSKGACTAADAAKTNMLVKGLQIPAYIFHFVIGVLGLFMSVWGIGFVAVAVIVDLLTIILTGVSSIGCAVKMHKEQRLTKPIAILCGIGSFIYCVDVAVAAWYMMVIRKDCITA